MTDADRWLSERLAGAPPALLARMRRALPDGDAPVPEALAGAASRLLAEVAAGSGGRDQALPLLAADALLTHAFQAQAEIDVAGVPELAERYGHTGALGSIARDLPTSPHHPTTDAI